MEGGHMVQVYKKLVKVWPQISSAFSPPKNNKELESLIEFADNLMDQTKGDEKHPLMGLLDVVGTLISDYERKNVREPKGSPIGCLKFLMQEHGLKQKDLTELGSPGVTSDIFSGRRELNKRQIKALSDRFGCSPAIFI